VAVSAHDYETAGKPACAWDDPEARDELVSGLVNDARAILEHLEGTELDDEEAQLVGLLALVAGQDVEAGEDEGTWRVARRVAPDRVISVVDPEARHMHKSRSEYRDGYKAHVAVEPVTGIVTACDFTPANTPDGSVGVDLLNGEEQPVEVLGDSAYGSGPTRADLAQAHHTAVIKPWPLPTNRRLGADQFTRDDFDVDYQAGTVTCPNGFAVEISPKGNATFGTRCRDCPLRSRCTASRTGRTIRFTEHDQLLAQARTDWRNHIGTDDYRQYRPMVERSIAWIVANGHRRVRYRGVERNRHALTLRAATLNLRRLINLGLSYTDRWALTPT
jgi:IS5 family transposase